MKLLLYLRASHVLATPLSFLKIMLVFLFIGQGYSAGAQCNIPVINGELNVCLNSLYSYSMSNLPGDFSQSDNYLWTISGGYASTSFPSPPQGIFKTILWNQPGTWTVTAYLSRCGTSFSTTIK